MHGHSGARCSVERTKDWLPSLLLAQKNEKQGCLTSSLLTFAVFHTFFQLRLAGWEYHRLCLLASRCVVEIEMQTATAVMPRNYRAFLISLWRARNINETIVIRLRPQSR